MPNNFLTANVIAKAAVKILDNELVAASKVFRGYEAEFGASVNGYEKGSAVTIKKPPQFQVRDGDIAQPQDITEGSTTVTVDKKKGIDLKITSTDRTLSIGELSERVIKPAMVTLANQVDQDVMSLYSSVPSWVGTPGNVLSSYAGFLRGTTRMNNGSVPKDSRFAMLSPDDESGLAAAQSTFYNDKLVADAYRDGAVGRIAQVDTYMSQNVPVHVTGSRTNGTVNGANQNVTYTQVLANGVAVKDFGGQILNLTGLGAAGTLVKGDVFTIAGVFAVNHVTKQVLPYLRQFTVLNAVVADGTGAAAVNISPAIIASGACQTVSAAPASGAVVTWMGAANTPYVQNIMAHKSAFALTCVPLVKPDGAVSCERESYKGLSVRLIPYYDGTNDVSNWRLDILYGVKAVDPRLAVRLNG
ncbi:P22 phage major capsid protein family protein [Methylobacterium sp. V23]|uniref:P22 phage major capsid protein family protein n=1 Tax=Methylobacterium sp. V23 TaxID=2044878 RepID=UPI000CDAA107|nr:P22 phage major capsid protein family protein [Methylobacterium sp. V23]POR42567.1 hypothetical protein CRT23_12315 [Methylobacterium sp. V23]